MFELQKIKKEIEIKGFNGIHYFEFGKDFTHVPEKHDFWEVVYVDSGEILAITDGKSRPLSQGQIIFHQPGELHAHVSDKTMPNNMLVISFSTDSEAMKFFSKKTFVADKTAHELLSLFVDEAKQALDNMPSEYNDNSNLNFENAKFGAMQLLSCYLTELFLWLIRTHSDCDGKGAIPPQMRKTNKNSTCELMCKYMKDNIYSGLSLSDICAHFMMGKSQLGQIFKSNMGKSIIEYYNELKIFEAKKLLRSDKYSISQISDILCYSCIHSFSRAFKKAVGFSPMNYKKKIL